MCVSVIFLDMITVVLDGGVGGWVGYYFRIVFTTLYYINGLVLKLRGGEGYRLWFHMTNVNITRMY